MRAPLSIIIPTLNAAEGLPGTLTCLIEGLQAGIVRELIVADGGSTDRTIAIAEAAGAEVITSAPSRGGQLKRGVDASQGDWVLLLHADTQLSLGWSEAVLDAMDVGQSGYFRLAFQTPRLAGRWVAGWANFRACRFGLPYGDQALLVKRDVLEAAGGVPDQPLMEDVALARALRGQLAMLPVTATTSFVRYENDGVLRRGTRNLILLLRYLAGADPSDLAERYRRR